MTKLTQASAAGEPIQVLAGGAWRIAMHVFEHPQGVVFVEPGWCNPELAGKFYFHLVHGEETGDGPWEVGGVRFERIPEQTDQIREWADAKDYEAKYGACRREAAEKTAAQEFNQ